MSKQKNLPAEYDPKKEYGLGEAVELLPQLSTSKFTGSVDVDIVLKASKKKNQETIRGSVSFPNSFGEEKKIIVFADEQGAKEATDAGAVDAGMDKLIKDVEDNKVDYDVVIATPDVMAKIAKLGRILGPKGLMPNPTSGTITTDITATVKAYMGGKQDFKVNEQNAVRGRVAKLDMKVEEIQANLVEFLKQVFTQAKKIDTQPFRKVTLSPTMGAPLKVDIAQMLEEIA